MKRKYAAALAASAVAITATAGVALVVNLRPLARSSGVAAAPAIVHYQDVYDAPPRSTAPRTGAAQATSAPRAAPKMPALAVANQVPATPATQLSPGLAAGPRWSASPVSSPVSSPLSSPANTIARPPTTTTPQPPAFQSAAYSTYGGVVTVDCTSASTIRLVSATPNEGYVATIGNPGPEQVEVHLVSHAKEFQVSAACVRGQPIRKGDNGGND